MTERGRCDHCTLPTHPGERYCRHCGAVLSLNTPPAEPPPRGAFLLVHLPGSIVRKEALRSTATRIGRSAKAEIVVDHPRVSRFHAVIDLREGGFWISDTKSTGGTFLNDRPVHAPVLLRSGDTCRLGREPGEGVTLVYHEEP